MFYYQMYNVLMLNVSRRHWSRYDKKETLREDKLSYRRETRVTLCIRPCWILVLGLLLYE